MKFFFTFLAFSLCSISLFALDWAKLNRYASLNKSITTPPKVVFYGNSITDFWSNHDADFFTDNNYVNRGISGQTTSEMLVRFRQDVIALKPKSVVILAGINDIAQNNGEIHLKAVLGNIQSMCELARANDITPIICSVLPCDYFKWKPAIKPANLVIQLNKMLAEYAKSAKIKYINYYSPLATPDGALNPDLTDDGCHPTSKGYEIMKSIISPALK